MLRPGMAGELWAFTLCLAAIAIGGSTAVAGQPAPGGSLSISIESDLPSLDVAGIASFNDRQAGLLLYDTLLDLDSKGRIVPSLAQTLEVAPDATWFKLTLRKDVRFTDGTPLDANAVVAHFKRILDPKSRFRFVSDLASLASVEATAPLEVTFKMTAPSAPFPAVLSDIAGMIESPAAVQKYGEDIGKNPVGSGPFMLKEWQRGAQIVFVRNPNYWKKPAYLDEVVLRPMPDENSRSASLKAGNLDVIMNATPRDVVAAKSEKKFIVIDPGSLGTNFVMINTARPDVSDVRVRQAMAYALDRHALNKVINKGLSKVANTVFGTGLSPHEAVDSYPNYDPARAKALLADYGKPVKLKLSVNASPVNVLWGQALQQMWKRVGIETEIDQLEQIHLIRAAGLKDYQVMLYRYAGGADPDKNVYHFFHSAGSLNRTAYSKPEMDKLLEQARSTTNSEARMELYRRINNLLARDLPYILLNYFNNFALVNPRVKGIVPIPDGLLRLNEVWKEK